MKKGAAPRANRIAQNLLVAFLLILTASCSSKEFNDDPCQFGKEYQYSGIALVLSSGAATFGSDDGCKLFISYESTVYERLAGAWDKSSYPSDGIRPVKIKAIGVIERYRNDIPHLKIEKLDIVDSEIDDISFKKAYEARFGGIPSERESR